MRHDKPDQTAQGKHTSDQSHLTLLHTLKGHSGVICDVAWSPDGRVLASGSEGTIQLWDGQSGRLLRTLKGHESSVYTIAWSPDSRVLAQAPEMGRSGYGMGRAGNCCVYLKVIQLR